MARVNIEEGAWPRITKLAGLLGISEREAAGTLYMLWRDSQEILAVEGSREDIVDWAHLYGLDSKEETRWLHAMERARFISKLDDGTYRIHGNDVQIEGRVARLHKASKGAAATKAKWESIKQAGSKPATSRRLPGQSSAVQSSAIQTSPMQSEENSAAVVLEPEDFLSDVSPKAFGAWCKAFGESFVREQLAEIESKWASDSVRADRGDKALYIHTWLTKAKSQRGNAARAGPRAETSIRDLLKAGGDS